MELRLTGIGAGQKLARNMDKAGQMVREAMRGAADDAAKEILARGRQDIGSAGNFGGNWQSGLQANIRESQRTIRIEVTMGGAPPVSYWKVFEYGASIFAHNPTGLMTWPNKSGFSVGGTVPAFISKAHVTIPQKFHLREIIADVAKELRGYYSAHMRS
jgi:hypothetical protein